MSKTVLITSDISIAQDCHDDVPDVIKFSIDEADVGEIVKLANLVKHNDVYKIVKFHYPKWSFFIYDTQSEDQEALLPWEGRMEVECMNVVENGVYWTAYFRYTDIKWETSRVLIKDLLLWDSPEIDVRE